MQDAQRTYQLTRQAQGGQPNVRVGRFLAQLGIAAGLLVCATGMTRPDPVNASTATTKPAETIIRMYPTAMVTGKQITLADLADIPNDAAALAAHWPIARAPQPGASIVVKLDQVQQILAKNGINLAYCVFRGSTACTVSASAVTASQSVQTSSSFGTPRSSQPTLSDNTASATPATGPIYDPNTLNGMLHAYIAQQLKEFDGTPVIDLPKTIAPYLELSRPTHDFTIIRRNDRLLGLVTLEITIKAQGQDDQVKQILVNVSLKQAVLVAAGQVNRNAIIEEDDLVLADRLFDRVDQIQRVDRAALIGQRAKRLIRQGESVGMNDVEPVPLVRRNDLVDFTIIRGGVTVTGIGRALSDGLYGERVQLRRQTAKRSEPTFTAVVTGPRKVQVGRVSAVSQQPAQTQKGER